MSEKRFSVRLRSECDGVVYSFFDGDKLIDVDMIVDLLNYQDRLIEEQHDEIINWTKKYVGIKKENEKLRMKLKGDDYIMVSEMLSNLRKTGICDGCKNKDNPVEWYLERGFSITGQICDRYEPED